VSLTFKPNNDFMIYALYSEGFRVGGINVFALPYPTLPQSFGSDTTKNYEIGTRFDLIDNSLSVDLTAYHIDWSNIQARLFTPDIRAYTVNGGGANVDGVELSLTLRPTRNLSISSNVSYNDARLSSLLPDSFAPGGGYARDRVCPVHRNGRSRIPSTSASRFEAEAALQPVAPLSVVGSGRLWRNLRTRRLPPDRS
jgi:outer membrane receptor protein involved in Fe transport